MTNILRWSRDRRRWSLFMLVVAMLGAGWTAASAVPVGTAGGERPASPRAGFRALPFTLDRLEGDPITLADLRGQVVVLNLWASWCPPCRAEMPALERVYAALKARGVVVLGVHMTAQDSEANAAAFVEELGLSFPILLDHDGAVGRLYHSRALPTTFFIDREGIIREVVVGGPLSEVTLRSTLERLVQEAGG